MIKHRLVAIDLDGTLIGRTWRISDRNRRAIRRVLKSGVRVTLATGRTFVTTEPYARSLRLSLPLICYHGALIRNRQKIFFSRRLPAKYVRPLIRFGLNHRVQVAVFSKEQVFFTKPLDRWGKEYVNRFEPVPEINLVDLRHYQFPERPHKVMFVASEPKLRQIEKMARRLFGRSVYITRSRSNLLEFLHPHVSKGRALRWIAHHYGIRMPYVMSIGDGYNDVSMLWMAGLGVAVNNAPASVKRKVDWVTRSVDENGVAEALEKFILKTE